jgi:hypothetical protein
MKKIKTHQANKTNKFPISHVVRQGIMALSLMSFLLLATGFSVRFAQAQTLFDTPKPPPPMTSVQPTGVPANRAISSDAFENVTKNLGQQNLNNLSQQVIQEVKKQMPAPPQTPPATQAPASSSPAKPQAPNMQAKPPAANPASAAPPVVSPPPAVSVGTNNTPPPAPAAGQPAAGTTQIYTGFGAGTAAPANNGNTSQPPVTNPSSGWNILY